MTSRAPLPAPAFDIVWARHLPSPPPTIDITAPAYADGFWAGLPEDRPTAVPDLAPLWRDWERRLRLDREQRGD